MKTTDHHELLRTYAQDHSESAFQELVQRYVDLVYSAAIRRVAGDRQLAEDVTQEVFTDLARKAAALPPTVMLGGWLHRHTGYVAATAMRAEQRRRDHERQAVEMNALNEPSEADWSQFAPVLDEAMDEMDAADRDALVLRYFERCELREVGAALGVSDDTAQKRVSRALEKLRQQLARRGITSPATALSAVIMANAVQAAPTGLPATISSAAVLTGRTLTSTSTITTTKATAMTALQKTLITTTLVTAVGAGIYEAHRASTLTSQLQTLQQQQTPLAEEIQRLRHDRDAATDQLAALRDSTNRPSRGASELLRLRSEVGLLREKNQQLAKLQPPQQPPSALAQALSDSNTIVVPSVVTTPMTPPRPINKSFETGQLRDVGNDSLESAAQTALWAILNRDEVGYGHIRFVDTNAPPVSAEDQARQLQQVARNMEGVQQLTLNAWMPDPLRADSAMVFFRAAWPSDSQAVDKPAGGTLVFRNVGAGWNLDSVISQGR